MPHLVIFEPGRMTFRLPLTARVRIGRGGDNELVLTDRQASRQHAVIEDAASRWIVADLGARHGTLVNGHAVTTHELRAGDVIQIGATTLTFATSDPPADVVLTQPTDLEAPPQRLRVFHDLAAAVAELDDAGTTAASLLAAIVRGVGAGRGALAVRAAGRPRVLARIGGELAISAARVADVLERGQAQITRGPDAMVAPLRSGGTVVGLLQVAEPGPAGFAGEDLELLVALGRLAGVALAASERLQRADALATLAAPPAVHAIQGVSRAIAHLREEVERWGAAELPVLVSGESGTGKELVARGLHAASPRADGPFVPVNCASLPAALVEAELFGHVKGAFTGAGQDRRGRLALAHGGTLFLDEVADLGPAGQAALLRVVEDGLVTPVGGERAGHVDVRVIAASHKPMAAEIAAGRFREDLYYRLAAVELAVPALRDRLADVPLLAEAFRATAAERHRRACAGFTPAALARLAGHPWPGNVRELKHEIERAVLVAAGPLIDVADLGARVQAAAPVAARPSPPSLAERFAALDGRERELIEEAMADARGNIAGAARALGITRIMLKRRLDRMALPRPGDEPTDKDYP